MRYALTCGQTHTHTLQFSPAAFNEHSMIGYNHLAKMMRQMPIIAILRGLSSEEVIRTLAKLHDCGVRVVHIPVKSPSDQLALERALKSSLQDMVIIAGKVNFVHELDQIKAVGGRFVSFDHCDKTLINCAQSRGLCFMPSVATATEAYLAQCAGAMALRLRHSEAVSSQMISEWVASLAGPPRFLIGGATKPDIMLGYKACCSAGFEVILDCRSTEADNSFETTTDDIVSCWREVEKWGRGVLDDLWRPWQSPLTAIAAACSFEGTLAPHDAS